MIPAFTVIPNSQTAPATFGADFDTWLAQVNAWSVAANALAVAMTAIAAGGAVSLQYTFSTTTTDADPGAGYLRLNNATQNTSTVIRTDLTGADGSNLTGVLGLLDDSTSTNKGYLRLMHSTDPTKWLIFSVTSLASPTGYRNVSVTVVGSTSANPFTNGDSILLDFTPTGDKGDPNTSISGNASGVIDMTAYAFNEAHGADIASATTTNLDTATGNLVDVTGTTTITTITLSEGHKRTVRFTGALTITNGASLVTISGGNIVTSAGDYAEFYGYAAGVVRMMSFSHQGVVSPAAGTLALIAASISNGDTTHAPDGNSVFDALALKAALAADNAYGDYKASRAMLIDCGYTVLDKGSVSSGTATFDYTAGSVQTWTNGGAHTVALSNPPPTGNLGELLLIGTNLGSAAITWPAWNWMLPAGTTSTSIATYLAANTGRTALATSGVDQILIWSRDAGTTVYAKLI